MAKKVYANGPREFGTNGCGVALGAEGCGTKRVLEGCAYVCSRISTGGAMPNGVERERVEGGGGGRQWLMGRAE
jgi:hypothetical protein